MIDEKLYKELQNIMEEEFSMKLNKKEITKFGDWLVQLFNIININNVSRTASNNTIH